MSWRETYALRAGRQRLRYLDRLLKMGEVPASANKRANWLHFCARCGVDISHYPRGRRKCDNCEALDRSGANGGSSRATATDPEERRRSF